jgi:hypothetical protein
MFRRICANSHYPLCTALAPRPARVAMCRARDASIDPESPEHRRIPSPSPSQSPSRSASLPALTPRSLPLRSVHIDPARRCSARAARVNSRAAFLGPTSYIPPHSSSDRLPPSLFPSHVQTSIRARCRRCPPAAPRPELASTGLRDDAPRCIVHTFGTSSPHLAHPHPHPSLPTLRLPRQRHTRAPTDTLVCTYNISTSR